MSRDRGPDQQTYRRVAEEIVTELRRGQSAAWITEGDPLFYSTFLHLYAELRRYPEVRYRNRPRCDIDERRRGAGRRAGGAAR